MAFGVAGCGGISFAGEFRIGLVVYALAWGINNSVLDRATYLPVVKKGLGWARRTHL